MKRLLLASTALVFVVLISVVLWQRSLSTNLPDPTTIAPASDEEPTPTPNNTSTASQEEEVTVIQQTATPLPTPDPKQTIDAILASMTLEEKVGQLFLVWFEGPVLSDALREMIVEYHIGGIVLFGISGNVETPRQVAALINDAQTLAVESGAGIPLFVAVDQEGGPVVRLSEGFTVFPSQMAVGATGSAEAARQVAQVTAAELRALGVNMVLAPVVDVNNNSDNPVIGIRSFGSSPDLVSELGAAMIEAYAQNGIIATAKHFPGHGDTDVDSHFGLPVVPHDRTHLDSVELPPFRAAIAAAVPAIMTAHVLLSAVDPDDPATLSPAVLTDLLRAEMGFDGLIVTDSLGMGALKLLVGTVEAAQLSLRAGADVLAFGADIGATVDEQRAVYQHILELVRSGEISEERLDASVRHILEAKAAHGLLDWTPVDADTASGQVGTADHHAVAAQIAEQSITLVRDEADLLPLAQEGQMLVVYPSFVGDLGEHVASCRPDLIVRPVGIDPTATDIEQIVLDAAIASTVVVGTVDARIHPAQVQLIEALADRPLVAVALEEPYDLLAFAQVETYLATYGHVPTSLAALARVLCGDAVPGGALPVEIPGLYPQGWRASTDVAATRNDYTVFLPSAMTIAEGEK